MVSITRQVRFSAARRLESGALTAEQNERLFGAGRRLHGRDFTLLVTLTGDVPDASGMVMDLKALSGLIRAEVVARTDHRLLDDCELLAGLPPTTENLAVAIWHCLEPRLPSGSLSQVELREGAGETVVRYRGE